MRVLEWQDALQGESSSRPHMHMWLQFNVTRISDNIAWLGKRGNKEAYWCSKIQGTAGVDGGNRKKKTDEDLVQRNENDAKNHSQKVAWEAAVQLLGVEQICVIRFTEMAPVWRQQYGKGVYRKKAEIPQYLRAGIVAN